MAQVRRLGWLLVLACLLSTLAFSTLAHADWIITDTQEYTAPASLPSFIGDIIVEATGSLTLTGYDLTLPGSVYVYGQLSLVDCSLEFLPVEWADQGLLALGLSQVEASDVILASASTGPPFYLSAEGTANTVFTRCRFDNVSAGFSGESTNGFYGTGGECKFIGYSDQHFVRFLHSSPSGNTIEDVTFHNLCAMFEGGTNTIRRCTFEHDYWVDWIAMGESTNIIEDCDMPEGVDFWLVSPSITEFHGCNLWWVSITGREEGDSLQVVDIHPGAQLPPDGQEYTWIGSSPDRFRVEFWGDTWVEMFHIRAEYTTSLHVDSSEIESLACYNYEATYVTDSIIHSLNVAPSQHLEPINVSVSDFHDSETTPLGAPPDPPVEVIAVNDLGDPSPFHITLVNTIVVRSWWEFGDWDLSSASEVTASDVGEVRATGSSLVTVRDTTCWASLWPYPPGATAQLVAEDCRDGSYLTRLNLDGLATTMTLRRSVLAGDIEYRNYTRGYDENAPDVAPSLVLESAEFAWAPNAFVRVGPHVKGARISGDVQIDPCYWVEEWWPESTITREYPVLVLDEGGNPVGGASIQVVPPPGRPETDTSVWEGITGPDGYAYPEVTFDDYNYDLQARLQVGWDPESHWISFLSSTPIVITLGSPQTSQTKYTWFGQGKSWLGWGEFAAGPGEAAARLQLGASLDNGRLAPPAHSFEYLMVSEVSGPAIAGLRYDLPYDPAIPDWPTHYHLQCWTYVDERTAGDTSGFYGLALGEEYPASALPWGDSVGLEVRSEAASRIHLGADAVDLDIGLTTGRWHLVDVEYDREGHQIAVRVNGEPVTDPPWTPAPVSVAGRPARFAVLGGCGEGSAASQYLCFDDAILTVTNPPWPGHLPSPWVRPLLDETVAAHEPVVTEDWTGYLDWGNYCVFYGSRQRLPAATDAYLAITFPEGYQFLEASIAPIRSTDRLAVWHMQYPANLRPPRISLRFHEPTTPTEAMIYCWATSDADAALVDPPNPADWVYPHDSVWGWPEVVRHQRIVPGVQHLPDLWVTKSGPTAASPGDIVRYIVTAGNSGLEDATEVTVADAMPPELGGGERILANLALLEPGHYWRGLVSETLPWGTEAGAMVNQAEVYSTAAGEEVRYDNNTADWPTTIQVALDPNHITVSPTGGVDRGDTLTYTVECENLGLGTAYGVYATIELDPNLDDFTLLVSPDLLYADDTGTLIWDVGTLAPGEGAITTFSVEVAWNAQRARPIMEQATVFFPSVPEETATNVVANIVAGSFSDVLWDHWALLQVEVTYENGIVRGFDDGTYRPAEVVDRGQMAVYVARAIARGDEAVPTGPVTPTFSDVDTDHWAYKYIEYAFDQQVVQGYEGGTYQPAWAVDRGQMAVYMARALVAPTGDAGVPDPPGAPTFSDVTPTGAWAWCCPHVEYVVDQGVVGGYPDGTYRPDVVVTRDQMAVYVTRAFRLPM